MKLTWFLNPSIFKLQWEALKVRGPLNYLLPSCNRKVTVITLIVSSMVSKEVDYRRDEWDIAERSPKAYEPWVKIINQMGADPQQLLWAQDRVSLSTKVELSSCSGTDNMSLGAIYCVNVGTFTATTNVLCAYGENLSLYTKSRTL
jgi:hypothetical protein